MNTILNRRTMLKLTMAAGAAALSGAPRRIHAQGRREKPNILLLMADQHRPDCMGCAGNKTILTPNLDQIAAGITLDDGDIHADAISYASDTDKSQVGIEIHSGKNRIVRRIFESLGYRVIKLDRVYFAGLTKKGLRRGDWRYLTEQEVAMLRMGSFE